MAARKKSASRKSAAKKKGAAKKAPKKAAKKVAKKATKKAAKKTAKSPKKRVAVKKAAPPRRTVAPPAAPPPPPMSPALMDIDQRIAIVRANLRDLAEQAASFAGAASEELASERIRTQEERLQALMQEREALVRQGN